MKLITQTQVTVDGVMQGNGGASEDDRKSGFTRAGWAMGVGGPETLEFITTTYQNAEGFLFGRRTYDLFGTYWGAMAPGAHAIADALNTAPKYLVSNTVTKPHANWPDPTIFSGDAALDGIRALKEKPGGELQVHGSGELIRWLLANGLVDEIQLIVVPAVIGQGTRLFPQDGPDLGLELVESRADSKGVQIAIYRPAGKPPHYAPAS